MPAAHPDHVGKPDAIRDSTKPISATSPKVVFPAFRSGRDLCQQPCRRGHPRVGQLPAARTNATGALPAALRLRKIGPYAGGLQLPAAVVD